MVGIVGDYDYWYVFGCQLVIGVWIYYGDGLIVGFLVCYEGFGGWYLFGWFLFDVKCQFIGLLYYDGGLVEVKWYCMVQVFYCIEWYVGFELWFDCGYEINI